MTQRIVHLLLASAACVAASGLTESQIGDSYAPFLTDELKRISPALYALVHRAAAAPISLAEHLRDASHPTVAPVLKAVAPSATNNATLPVVLAHGMGDSCFNPGFKSVTKAVGDRLGVYATCKPTGDNVIMDTINGFLMNMDKSVDEFATRVRADPKLVGGFNALGLSQGNNLIRGYIQKYNDPPVNAFISVCGINGGVASFPQCLPTTPVIGGACVKLDEILGDLAYIPLIQSILFQADYFRDPERLHDAAYKNHSQLAQWNGEGSRSDPAAARANWAKTSRFVWVRGTKDTVVYPNEAEQWGALGPGYPQNKSVLPMEQTAWYNDDAFGLKTADKLGKNSFEEFAGEHIRFSEDELNGWLDKYFTK